ncbi:MAG: ornithine carbamoyltransferase [Bacteroidota bacterium]|nr:ornithine carbamoyltransferase [Bacteroidota bacterium]MDP4231748.1 ornithine carbamoyltransferase [Bacteroidota bacterium]MDP4243484.1 ornithine carbamoyltransferase [Bacteroidota bacterium]MDP4289256.1 ornithine carbamoyltransferase [Bacteroidota bacterium]
MQTKEEILTSALPYIQRYEGKTFVIKYGGAAMIDDGLKDAFAKDVTLLKKIGINVVIVHGGGNSVTDLAMRLGTESRFVGGQRYTDEAMLKNVVMTLAGSVNKDIVGLINHAGGSALGLSGIDNNLITAKKYAPKGFDLGLVGEVESVNVAFLNTLIGTGVIPVIAPVGVSTSGEVYNINADIAASGVAQALGAEKLFFLSDTEGVLVEGELVPTLTNARAQQLIKQGVISGGMIPKVHAAFEALANGVKKVHLINGATNHSLLLEIFTHEGVGTQIIREEKVFGRARPIKSAMSGTSTLPVQKQDLLDLTVMTKQDFEDLMHLTDVLKHTNAKPLAGKHVTLLFQKPSLRTRVSFEVGVAQLGGTSLYLSNEGVGLGEREAVSDVARVLASYSNCIVARLFDHNILLGLAEHANVPIVNALTDQSHPCQILADLYTIRQHGKLRPGLKIAFVGDGNNVANSWIEMAAIYPMHLSIASPHGYAPDAVTLARAQAAGISTIEVVDDPRIAADSADAIYTDVWTSMGQESEQSARRAAFKDYQINAALTRLAHPNALIMHCLPAHRGEEITAEAMDSANSVIFDQAENRLHVQKAILVTLLAENAELNEDPQHETVGEFEEYGQTEATVHHS